MTKKPDPKGIVERLATLEDSIRAITVSPWYGDTCRDAAVEITRLRAREAELVEALRPFGIEANAFGDGWADERRVVSTNWKTTLTIGDLRRARTLTTAQQEGDQDEIGN